MVRKTTSTTFRCHTFVADTFSTGHFWR